MTIALATATQKKDSLDSQYQVNPQLPFEKLIVKLL